MIFGEYNLMKTKVVGVYGGEITTNMPDESVLNIHEGSISTTPLQYRMFE